MEQHRFLKQIFWIIIFTLFTLSHFILTGLLLNTPTYYIMNVDMNYNTRIHVFNPIYPISTVHMCNINCSCKINFLFEILYFYYLLLHRHVFPIMGRQSIKLNLIESETMLRIKIQETLSVTGCYLIAKHPHVQNIGSW